MWLFKKKKSEDEEEEEIVRQPLRKNFPKREIKDLKPENRKKRKEPPKPWGRKERFLILFLLGGTTIASGLLALSARAWRLPGMPRINFPMFSFEETYILEREETNPQSNYNYQPVIEEFEKETQQVSGIYGFSVRGLTNNTSYGLYESELFPAASLIKLPVMVAAMKAHEEGILNLDDSYLLQAEDKAPGAGSLYSKPVGTELTYRELVEKMGQESDNTAFRAIRKTLGDEYINQVISELGMIDTSLSENLSTPSDIASLFQSLWNGDYITVEASREILNYLTDTIYEDRIPAGIPDTVRVAHKVGTDVGTISDAGIVFSDEPFILVLMSKGVIEKEARDALPRVTQTIYSFESDFSR